MLPLTLLPGYSARSSPRYRISQREHGRDTTSIGTCSQQSYLNKTSLKSETNMGWNDHVDWELNDAIQDLLDEGLLIEGTAGHGIALQVINQGYDSLKGKQLATFNKWVAEPLKRRAEDLAIRRVIESNPE